MTNEDKTIFMDEMTRLYLESKRTEENGKKKCTVLFSYLLEKKDRTYNSVNDSEIFALEIELFAPVVRV